MLFIVNGVVQISKEAHAKSGHGGRGKMIHEIAQHSDWIPSKIIDTFLPACVSCQVRKPLKLHVVSNAIVSFGFLGRLQIDHIDRRTRPDGEIKWILHCRDHIAKFLGDTLCPRKHAMLQKICCLCSNSSEFARFYSLTMVRSSLLKLSKI